MKPSDELRIITKMIIPEETYHRKIQQQLEKSDSIKRHSDSNTMEEMMDEKIIFQDLLADKIGSILGG